MSRTRRQLSCVRQFMPPWSVRHSSLLHAAGSLVPDGGCLMANTSQACSSNQLVGRIEHVHMRKAGGTTVRENLLRACRMSLRPVEGEKQRAASSPDAPADPLLYTSRSLRIDLSEQEWSAGFEPLQSLDGTFAHHVTSIGTRWSASSRPSSSRVARHSATAVAGLRKGTHARRRFKSARSG